MADAEANFCFFKFMADLGDGRPVQPAKIAHLLMIDDSEVKDIVQKFRESNPLDETKVDDSETIEHPLDS